MKRILVALVVTVSCPAWAAPQQPAEPRVLLRVDVAFLAEPNVGLEGGGGILLPVGGGTAAGLHSGGGVEVGLEMRLTRWLALDAGVGWYRPSVEVVRGEPGTGVMLDDRSASVDLRNVDLGLVLAPPKLRSRSARLAFCAFATSNGVSGVPPSLGLTVDTSEIGFGIDARGELFFSKNRHWGVGMALGFSSMNLGFSDLETGATGTLQVSGMTLQLGLRGTW